MNDRFEQARQAFLAGLAAFEAGHIDEAAGHYERSLTLLPGRPSTLVNLGAAYVLLRRPADALPLLDAAVDVEPKDAHAWAQRGLVLTALSRDADAVASFDRALVLRADDAPTVFHRAMALNRLGRHEPALAAFDRLVEWRPDHAETWFRRGQTQQSLGAAADALASYDRALVLDATHAQAWSNRGGLLKDARRLDEAAHCFEQAIAHGGDAALNGFFLASVRGDTAPAAAPEAYVEQLFDTYADEFDTHLTQQLGYTAPQRLAERLAALHPAPFDEAIDLGCGTGLCGPLLQPMVRGGLDGIDLSQRMLDKAAVLGVYRDLLHDDVVRALDASPRRYELVVAADSLIYIGVLEPVFAAVRRVITPGGLFAFTAEDAGQDGPPPTAGYTLRPSSRYAHTEAHLRELAARHAFAVVDVQRHALRHDQGTPIPGLVVVLGAR